MKITVLAENTSEYGFPAEHGLSLYVETCGKKLLFDSGQSALFAENAARLGVDLAQVDLCVLSHGHYDHSGGFGRFTELNDHAKIYMSRYAFGQYHNAEGKYIGPDPASSDSDRIVLTDGVTRISEGMTLYSCYDREKIADLGAFGLTMVRGGETLPDDFRHEHYLLVEENGRRILFSGCSHKGVLNIVDWFRPDILIGGFHLMKMPLDDALIAYAKRLDAYDTAYYTCHCTGAEQYKYMKPYMQRLRYLSSGQIIEI